MAPDRYSFLLRIWQAGTPQAPYWRASLEDARSHRCIAFNSLEDLFQFIRTMPEFATKEGIPNWEEFSKPAP